MFEFLKRRKRTLVEKIVDKARIGIARKLDMHTRLRDEYTRIAHKAIKDARFHNGIVQELSDTLLRIDNPPQPKPEPETVAITGIGFQPARVFFSSEDFDGGNLFDDDELSAAITADMGDGRAAQIDFDNVTTPEQSAAIAARVMAGDSDTLDKINEARQELEEYFPPAMPKLKRKKIGKTVRPRLPKSTAPAYEPPFAPPAEPA